jgi:malonyl-CoA O-methyltransferase
MSIVAKNFSASAIAYDGAARIQPLVAARLAAKLCGNPSRILEIGCGTGGLSVHLAKRFPDAELVLTDIAPQMLEICQSRLGDRALFKLMDGEKPNVDLGAFDLIVSSFAMQWFSDLTGAMDRLARMLKSGGKLVFATLGSGNFLEWSALLNKYGFAAGLHDYPDASAFPWPNGVSGNIEEEFIEEKHASGMAFLKSLKAIGANVPQPGHKPAPPATMKRLLSDTANGFTVTYHVLYGSLTVS